MPTLPGERKMGHAEATTYPVQLNGTNPGQSTRTLLATQAWYDTTQHAAGCHRKINKIHSYVLHGLLSTRWDVS